MRYRCKTSAWILMTLNGKNAIGTSGETEVALWRALELDMFLVHYVQYKT